MFFERCVSLIFLGCGVFGSPCLWWSEGSTANSFPPVFLRKKLAGVFSGRCRFHVSFAYPERVRIQGRMPGASEFPSTSEFPTELPTHRTHAPAQPKFTFGHAWR